MGGRHLLDFDSVSNDECEGYKQVRVWLEKGYEISRLLCQQESFLGSGQEMNDSNRAGLSQGGVDERYQTLRRD